MVPPRRIPALASLLVLVLLLGPGCPQDDDDDTTAPPEEVDAPALAVAHDSLPLTEQALEAVSLVPAWLADDLAINLGRVGDELQDELARLVIDAEDPYMVDEIGFGIAHTSPEILEADYFYPELLSGNAEMIYEVDLVLPYVELVEVGEPGDPDYHTTTTYLVEIEAGVLEERTIDRDLYYWFVAHPRLEDELPVYVDGWESGDPVAPGEGYHWREFLWDRAADDCPEDRTCPLLAELLPEAEILSSRGEASDYESTGHGQVWAFIGQAIHWGAGDERPVQPNRIYAVGCGNCGEYADLFVSSARTALIPAQNVGARSNDHTWGEWWDDQWWGEFGKYAGGVSRNLMDDDCDGVADDALDTADGDGDGWSVADGDCDDTDAAIHPDAGEEANARDDDCDGVADDAFADSEVDADGDGFSIQAGDCRDADALVYPGAVELIDGLDNDCDGVADDGMDETDADEDGIDILSGDCDDNNAAVYPDAPEAANGRDDDCDGVADEGQWDVTADADEDGYSVLDGDCHDGDPEIHPGAVEEEGNYRDDDCDGTPDNLYDDEDHDGDGHSLIWGDCDDGDPTRHPDAVELANGVDDDCDDVVDDGARGHDRDGDGWILAEGDCDDTRSGAHPDVNDPGLSSNRLYIITSSRGDTFISTERTESYGTLKSTLEFEVTDDNGDPVDGAIIFIYGTWEVYGYPDEWAWAGEVVTDLDGRASTLVGEYNPYGYSIYTPIGDEPGGNYLKIGVDQSQPNAFYLIGDNVDGTMPARPEATQVDADGAGVTLSFAFEVESYRVSADGAYSGSFSREYDGGRLDAFVLDDDNYARFLDDEDFEAWAVEQDVDSADVSLDLPLSDGWQLVLSNRDTLSSTMVGSLSVSAGPSGDETWVGDSPTLESRLRIPPGEHLAIELVP